jgi:lysozyme family protein
MAQLPDLVGTDLASGRKLAAPDASPKVNTGTAPDGMGTPTVDAHMDATPIVNSGEAVENAANQANQVVMQQVDAAQKTWLLNASAQHELDAQQMLSNAQRNAAPGQEITPLLSDALNQNMQQKAAQVDSPLLAQNYQNEMTRANQGVLSQAQAFDFQQRDAAVENNFKQGIDAQQKTLSLLTDPGQIESKFGEMMSGVNSNIASLPLAPNVKLQLQDYARKNLTDAANQTAINLDPKGFLARNTGTPASATQQFASTAPGSPIDFVQAQEGTATVANDGGKGLTKFGVNQAGNPDVNVANLTQDQAKQILQTRYIDKVVTPGMSPQMALVAGDTAVNMGVSKAQDLIAQSGGDPQKLIDLRRAQYQQLAQSNPAQYAQYLPGWNARLDALQQRLPDVTPRTDPGDEPGTTVQNIGGWAPMQLSTYDQRAKNVELAQNYSDQEDKQAQQQQAVQKAAFNSDFNIALNRGQKTYQDIENAYQAGMISPTQRTEYTKTLDDVNGNNLKGMAAMGRVQDTLNGTGVLDPKNADDRAAVDRHYEGWLQQQPQPQNDQDKALLQAKEVDMAGKYGMLPKTMVGGLAGSLRSNKPEDVTNAAGMINQIRQTNPALLSDIPENDLKGANHIQSLVMAGYTPPNAVAAAQQELKVTPDVKQYRTDEADAALKDGGLGSMATSSINGQYSSKNPLNNTADVTWSKADIPSDMKAAWNEAYKNEYIRTGNPNTATQTATDLISNTYQRTNVGVGPNGNSTRWMQSAPEQYYSAPVKVDQSKWMNEQLEDDIGKNTINPGTLKAENMQLVPSGKTNEQGLPTYNVWTVQNGASVPLQTKTGNLEWYPDWNTSKELDRYKARARYSTMTPQQQDDQDRQDSPITTKLGSALEGMAN